MIAQKTLTPTLERIPRQRLYLPFFHLFMTGGVLFSCLGLAKNPPFSGSGIPSVYGICSRTKPSSSATSYEFMQAAPWLFPRR